MTTKNLKISPTTPLSLLCAIKMAENKEQKKQIMNDNNLYFDLTKNLMNLKKNIIDYFVTKNFIFFFIKLI